MRTPPHPYAFIAALAAVAVVAGAETRAIAAAGDAVDGREWSTYYGDSDAERDAVVATARDGGVVLAGRTRSTHGLATAHTHQTAGGGDWDAVLVHLDADGNRRWATYFGGDDVEQPTDLAVTAAGSVYLVGSTRSAAQIAADGAHKNCIDGGLDGFLVAFGAHGERLWSTYVGGDGEDELHAVAVDEHGAVYVCGATTSDYGVAIGDDVHQDHRAGQRDAFLASFDADGDLRWSTYFGGAGEDACLGLAVRDGRVYVTGRTTSHDHVASPGAFQPDHRGDEDGFVAAFDRDGARVWSTYVGGDGRDRGESLAVDRCGDVYAAGTTGSSRALADGQGFQRSPGGGDDLFLVRFTSAGERVWGTYYGGEADEAGADLALDGGRIVLAGDTRSTTRIATPDAPIAGLQGEQDVFFVEFDRHGQRRRASYFGGEDRDHGVSLAFHDDGGIYLGGTAEDSFDEPLSGTADLFVARVDLGAPQGATSDPEAVPLASGCDRDPLGGDGSLALLLGIFPVGLRRRAGRPKSAR